MESKRIANSVFCCLPLLCSLEYDTRPVIMPAPAGAGEKSSAANGSNTTHGASYAQRARGKGPNDGEGREPFFVARQPKWRPPPFGQRTWSNFTKQEQQKVEQYLLSCSSRLAGARTEIPEDVKVLLLSGPDILGAASRSLQQATAAEAGPKQPEDEKQFSFVEVSVPLTAKEGSAPEVVKLVEAVRAAERSGDRDAIIRCTERLHIKAFEDLVVAQSIAEPSVEVQTLLSAVRGCVRDWDTPGGKSVRFSCKAEVAAAFKSTLDVELPCGLTARCRKLADVWTPVKVLLRDVPVDISVAELEVMLMLSCKASGVQLKGVLELSAATVRGPSDSAPWQRIAAGLQMDSASGTAAGNKPEHKGMVQMVCRTDVATQLPVKMGITMPSGFLHTVYLSGRGIFGCTNCGMRHRVAQCKSRVLQRPTWMMRHPQCGSRPAPAPAAQTQPVPKQPTPRQPVPAQNAPPPVSALVTAPVSAAQPEAGGFEVVTPRRPGAKRPATPGSNTPQPAQTTNRFLLLSNEDEGESDGNQDEISALREATCSAPARAAEKQSRSGKQSGSKKQKQNSGSAARRSPKKAQTALPSEEQVKQAKLALECTFDDLDEHHRLVRRLLEPVLSELQSEGFPPEGQHVDYLCDLGDEDVLEIYRREPEFGVWKTKERIASLEAFAARGLVAVEAPADTAHRSAAAPTEQVRAPTPTAEMDTAETVSTAATDAVAVVKSAAATEALAAVPADIRTVDASPQMEVDEAVTSPSRGDPSGSELTHEQTEQPMSCEQVPSDCDSSGAAGAGGHTGSNACA